MKGKLEKTIKGQWVVRVISEETPECDTIIEHGKQLPVHPDYVKYYFLDEDADGGEVEFEIVNKLWGTNDDIISYAKLIKPGMGSKVNLQRLEAKLDKILADETPESFHEWLERKTGPIRSYHSPKIAEMLAEIMEEDAKNGLYEDDIEMLAKKHYPEFYSIGLGSDRIGFERGYNLAKKTLYSEEDIDKLLSYYADDAPGSYIKRDYKKYLESLKKK